MNDSRKHLPHLERIMFVVGEQNAGKSTELRGMFVDPKFGSRGAVPTEKRLRLVLLSRERCLFIRLTSPHETKQDIEQFIGTIDAARRRAARLGFRRFNVACALQPFAAHAMPDLLEICAAIQAQLEPERMRVVVIDPRQDGEPGPTLERRVVQGLRSKTVELVKVDGEHSLDQHPNGLLLADFFDFT
ncbi:hypothetical protein [Burkholderia ubonensis]|uniref:hypothetical protein n=1 Tax=Burkholderia ubonensis TaxID=101571 RepID=UPI0009B37B6E|nr:hypothetical protein [Burkholderia ubonensis]